MAGVARRTIRAKTYDKPWWSKDDYRDPAGCLVALIRAQFAQQEWRYTAMRRYIAAYEIGAAAADRYGNTRARVDDDTLYLNAAMNAVDTVVAEVCSQELSPMAMTKGGTWEQKQRSEDVTKALEGEFDELEINKRKADAVRDFALAGAGFLKVFHDGEQLCAERMLPGDVLFDEAESRYGKPRCAYTRSTVDRFAAAAQYEATDMGYFGSAAKRLERIMKAPQAPADHDGTGDSSAARIEIFEAWHLPSRMVDEEDEEAVKKTDGVHVICIDGCTLVRESFTWDRFPFESYIAKRSHTGVWGIPLMRQMLPSQREFEKLSAKVQLAHRRIGGVHILAPKSAKIEKRKLTNATGDIWEFDGPNKPEVFAPMPVNPETIRYRMSLPQEMMQFSGISGFSASGELPAAMNGASGRAIQLTKDQGSKNFTEWHQELGRFVVGVADLVVRTAKDLVKVNPSFATRYRDKTSFTQIDWKDLVKVLRDKKAYVLQTSGVGALAKEPGAKLAQLTELLNVEAITVEQFRRNMNIPDMESENDVDLADQEVIDKNLTHILTTGKYLSPEPFDNLALCVSRGGKFYNACRRVDVPEARLQLLRQFIADAQKMIPPPAPPMPMPGMPPMGAPPLPPPGVPPGMPIPPIA